MTLSYTTITGTFKDGGGKNLTGTAVFTPSCAVYDSAGTLLTADLAIQATIVDGVLNAADGTPLTLLATDNDGLAVEGRTGFWYWTVAVNVTGDKTTDTWAFFLPSDPDTVDLYALANTAAQPGGGGGDGAVASVDGRTGAVTLTDKYAQLADNLSDLPSASVARTNLGLGTAATHDADEFGGLQAWQFHVKNYGAVGDGKVINDAAITSGAATLTSASAGFTADDVGKAIMVNNAGQAVDSSHSGALITTITAVTNSTTAVLGTTASRTTSGASAVYGTDDTTAIQTAMQALGLSDEFTVKGHYAELLFDPRIYVLSTAATPGGDPAHLTYGNAQIPLPVVDVTGHSAKSTVVIKGTLDGSVLDFFHQQEPQLSGACLLSMIEVNAYDGTYGPPSVIGGPTITDPFDNHYDNILAVIDGIQVVCPFNPGQIAYDFDLVCQFAIKTASADVFASVESTPSLTTLPTNARGMALRVPTTGINDRCDIGSLSIEGYYYGMTVDEHIACQRVAVIYSNTAFYIPVEAASGSSKLTHAAWFGYASLEVTDYCVYAGDTGAGGSLFGIVIDVLDNEGAVTAHIYDPNNALTGRVNLLPSGSDSLPQTPLVTGAANLEVKSLAETLGAFTPDVPATTEDSDPIYRDVDYYVTSGTLTDLEVDGVSVGTPTQFRVPAGKVFTPTYSSTLDLVGVKS